MVTWHIQPKPLGSQCDVDCATLKQKARSPGAFVAKYKPYSYKEFTLLRSAR